MKSKFVCLLDIALLVFFAGCSNDSVNDFFSRPDPFDGSIAVFQIDKSSAMLTWDADKGADNFIVMKAKSTNYGLTAFQEITNTSNTDYVDNDIEENIKYVYRLDKKRGDVLLTGSIRTLFSIPVAVPLPSKVTTQRLNGGTIAYITWEADANADKYCVLRIVNRGDAIIFNDDSNEIYSGSELFCFDNGDLGAGLDINLGYIYRLDKFRNGVRYKGTELTFYSDVRPEIDTNEAPNCENFREPNKVYITWKVDPGADLYRIMRFPNGFTDAETGIEIYNGIYTSCIDDFTLFGSGGENYMFLYRIDKKRNTDTEWKKGIRYGHGVNVNRPEDANESNNTSSTATQLDSVAGGINASIYYYRFSDGAVLEDKDFYKIYMPPSSGANIRIVYNTSHPYGGNPPSEDAYLDLQCADDDPINMLDATNAMIRNSGSQQRYVTLQIYPSNTFKSSYPASGGGWIVGYKILINDIF